MKISNMKKVLMEILSWFYLIWAVVLVFNDAPFSEWGLAFVVSVVTEIAGDIAIIKERLE